MEMTLAMIGAILLLFGSLKVFVWLNKRMVARQQVYEATRTAAGSRSTGGALLWDQAPEREKLNILR